MTRNRDSLSMKAESWCLKHDILVYGTGYNATYLKVEINFQGLIIPGIEKYKIKNIGAKAKKWWNVINTIRIEYYKKYKDDADFQ